MLIVALVLAAVGLTALVTAVVTSNEVLAFVCIAAAATGVVLMIVDAIRDRHAGALGADEEPEADSTESDGEQDPESAEDHSNDGAADIVDDPEAVAAESDSSEAAISAEQPSTTSGAVSVKEAATAAHHHPSAEETYEQFDVDDEDEDEDEPRSQR